MNIRFIKTKKTVRKRNRLGNLNDIQCAKSIFIILCAMFLVGIILGTLYFKNNMDEGNLKNNINPFENITDFDIIKKDIFIDSACQNLIILLLFWIVGLSIIGVPILILFIVYEGISIGISISYILVFLGFFRGYSYIYIAMYLTTLINIISIFILCYSAIKVSLNIIKKNREIKTEFIRHSSVCIIMSVLFFLSSFFETYLVEIGKKVVIR